MPEKKLQEHLPGGPERASDCADGAGRFQSKGTMMHYSQLGVSFEGLGVSRFPDHGGYTTGDLQAKLKTEENGS